MTLIVGLVEPDGEHAIVAADSRSFDGYGLGYNSVQTAKLSMFYVGGYVLTIGIAGSWRISQIIRHALEVSPPSGSESVIKWIVSKLTKKLRATLKEGGALTIDELTSVESMESDLLINFRGHVYGMQSDFSLLRDERPISAVGHGGVAAMASLYTSGLLDSVPPMQRVQLAMKSTAMIDATVGEPFHIVRVPQGKVSRSVFTEVASKVAGD